MSDVHGDVWARGAPHDFAVNVVGGPRPAWVDEALRRGAEHVGAYPDESAAVEAVARRHARDPDEVVLLNGATQAFWLVAAAARPRRPVVVQPTFSEYARALTALGCRPRWALLAEPWALHGARVPDDADLVVVGNPTNPTGVLHPAAVVGALARPGRVLVVDEAFMDFVEDGRQSLAGVRLPGLVVVRSLTKSLGIPGLRAGYLLAEPELAARIRAVRPAWSVNALALAVAAAAADREEWFRALAARTARDRASLTAALQAVPAVTTYPSSANFALIRIDDGPLVVESLKRDGIAVRPAAGFPGLGAGHIRVAVRDAQANALLVDALARAVKGHRCTDR